MTDIAPFLIGLLSGAAAAGFSVLTVYRKYVRNCGLMSHRCPHHGPANQKLMAYQNEQERRKSLPPPR